MQIHKGCTLGRYQNLDRAVNNFDHSSIAAVYRMPQLYRVQELLVEIVKNIFKEQEKLCKSREGGDYGFSVYL